MADTEIAWTDKVWNPVLGCSRVSPGCENCYAERFVHRGLQPEHRGLTVKGGHGPRWSAVRCLPDRLEQPLGWRRAQKIFVNSLSDLFHEQVPDAFIDQVFAVMALAQGHTFQVLTKRPERMRDYLASRSDRSAIVAAARGICDARLARAPAIRARASDPFGAVSQWPLPNVWLLVSVENQETADERIPLLLQTPAAVRGVSYEPALGPVDFRRGHWIGARENGKRGKGDRSPVRRSAALDWIIVGGESGPGARPCDVEWIRATIQQCREAGVACFTKQLGARTIGLRPHCARCNARLSSGRHDPACDRSTVLRNRKGADPSEWPEDLRIRQSPADIS